MPGDRSTIPVVFAVDVEPDGPGHRPAPPGPWSGALRTHEWLTAARAAVAGVTGRPAHFTWTLRMDGGMVAAYGSATVAADAHPGLVADAVAQGDELGVHIHGWRRDDVVGWVDDFRDEAWLAHCVDVALDGFQAAIGRPCGISRIGNRYSSAAVLDRLAGAGVRFDLTMEAGRIGTADGGIEHLHGEIPDYRRVPRRPHRLPSGLIEIPLTASSKRLGGDLHARLSRMRRHGVLERLDQPMQFGGGPRAGETFGSMIRRSLARQRRPYLCFAVRSDGILDPEQGPRLHDHLDQLLRLPEAPRFAFVTPAECVEVVGVG